MLDLTNVRLNKKHLILIPLFEPGIAKQKGIAPGGGTKYVFVVILSSTRRLEGFLLFKL